jgi:hypothetical protein
MVYGSLDQTVDFETSQSDELNNLLGKFYAEAAPIFSKKRSKETPQAQSQEYHKNAKKNIRAAINRHIKIWIEISIWTVTKDSAKLMIN